MTTTPITVRTNPKIKQQAQEFFDSVGLSLSAGVNLFLADVASNRRLSFSIHDPVELVQIGLDDLPDDVKKSYHASLQSEDLTTIDASDVH